MSEPDWHEPTAAERMTLRDYAGTEQVRDRLRRSFAGLLADYDCLLGPVHEDCPNRLDQPARRMKLTWAFDMTGQPALLLPAAELPGGFPFGLQVICASGQDARQLAPRVA